MNETMPLIHRSAFIVPLLYATRRMLRTVLGSLWRRSPARLRRWGVWLVEPRFAVTAGAVVTDGRGRVLLLNHVFRRGSGWGIPGGFLAKGEQPEDAVRRELCEETGIELDRVELAFVRTIKRPRQVEIIFRCHTSRPDEALARGIEIKSLAWFAPEELPAELMLDQHRLIACALNGGAQSSE